MIHPNMSSDPSNEKASLPQASFNRDLRLPHVLEMTFRSFWNGIIGGDPSRDFTPALVAFSQTWLWLKNSPEARNLRKILGRIYMDECQLRRESNGVGAAVGDDLGAAEAIRRDTHGTVATSESQLARREMELLEGLRENQHKMQMAASESESIRCLRTLVAPGNLEQVLQLARRITLG